MKREQKLWMEGKEALYKELGRRLREARLDAGLRLADVEHRTDIWASHLSMAERGISLTKLHEVLTLANLYEITVEELLKDLPL